MAGSAPTSDSLVDRAPLVFVWSGILLMVLAVYMAGTERMACDGVDGRVGCHIRRARVLGLVTVERDDATDVVDAGVRTSITEHTEYRAGRSTSMRSSSANHTLVLKTRLGHEVDALGGENSEAYTDRVLELLKRPSRPPIELSDSTWPVAIFCFALGLVLFAFGAIASHVQRAERQANPPTSS